MSSSDLFPIDPTLYPILFPIGIGIISLAALIIYFLPALVAIANNHPNLAAIIVLDILTGWTLIGWVAAFIWAAARPATVPPSLPIR